MRIAVAGMAEADELEQLARRGLRRSPCRRPRIFRPNSTFCAAVMFGNSEYAWKTMPMSRLFGETRVTSLPSTTIAPASGRSKPATSRSAVVLPQPDGPSSERNSPWPSSTSMPVERRRRRRSARCRFWSSRYAISVAPPMSDGRRAPRLRPMKSRQSIAAQVMPKLISVTRRGRIGLRLVDVLDVDRERVERREVRDRELAHHDREGEERARERRRADVREDHLERASSASSRRGSATPRSACARRSRGSRRRARRTCTGRRGSRTPRRGSPRASRRTSCGVPL